MASADSLLQRALAQTEEVPIGRDFVEGYLSSQQNRRADEANSRAWNEDRRAEETLDMKKEQFGWARGEHDRLNFLRAGMAAASQDGGYEGVIDFLKVNDPEKALEFTQSKLALDKSIMSNEVMKATSKRDIANAMVESYGVIGKMGAAILQAPASDLNSMYQQMLPILKTVNPEAPTNLNSDAVSMFMLSAAQAMPVNQLFGANKQIQNAQSQIGKLNADIENALNSGKTPDDPDIQVLMGERQKYMNKQAEAGIKLTNAEIQQDISNTKTKVGLANIYNTNINKYSGNFIKAIDGISGALGSLDAIEKNPQNDQAQAAFYRSFAKSINGGGVMTDLDVSDIANSSSVYQAGYKALLNLSATDGGYKMTPVELRNAKDLFYAVQERKLSNQKNLEQQFIDQAINNKVSIKDLILPSSVMQKSIQDSLNPATTSNAQDLEGMASSKIQEIQSGIQSGNISSQQGQQMIQAVNAKLQMLQQQNSQSSQQVQNNMLQSNYGQPIGRPNTDDQGIE